MRRKKETLREELLGHARQIAEKEGADAISIRRIAGMAGIAAGTVYHYFADKDDILLALTDAYWRQSLADLGKEMDADTFPGQLVQIYTFLGTRMEGAAGMLMGSLGNVEADGKKRMQGMQQVLQNAVIACMDSDKAIQKDIWNDTFTKEQYAGFIVRNLMLLLGMRDADINFLLEIVKRTLYPVS